MEMSGAVGTCESVGRRPTAPRPTTEARAAHDRPIVPAGQPTAPRNLWAARAKDLEAPRDQEFTRPDGKVIDLAATDVLRIRELGVPRYCQFRRLLHLEPPASFAELTDDAELAAEMDDLYDGDIEQVDLMVGLFAEKRPTGFAFSDTAFRIFIVMASRRLTSDRFLTDDFTPAVYTAPGMQWLADNTMASVILRHYPQLRPAMRSAPNAFMPWQRPGARA